MSLDELMDKVSVRQIGSGCYKVTIEYRGKFYQCRSNNSFAYDRLVAQSYQESDRQILSEYTLKQAFQALYDECKRKNSLN